MVRGAFAVRALALVGLLSGACSLLVPDDEEYVGGSDPVDAGSGGSAGSTGGHAGAAGSVISGGSSGTGGGTGGATGGSSGTGGSGGVGGSATGGAGGGCTPSSGTLVQAEPAIYLMVDRTSSMSTEWNAVQNGVSNYLQNGLGEIALQYFPPPGQQAGSCAGTEFATPEIAMASVSTNESAILQSLGTVNPQLGNATLQGVLIGGLAYARDYAVAHPELQVNLALLTDWAGQDGCTSQTSTLSSIAKAAADADPPVRTFIGAFEGASLSVLDQIASAGGSVDAEPLGGGTDTTQFLRRVALSCRFTLPQPISSGTVSAVLSSQFPLQQVASAAQCSQVGSEFFLSGTPATALELCPMVCSLLNVGSKATIDVQVQCP